MTTDDVLSRSAPLIGQIGGAYYFRPETVAVGKEHGLDGFRFYFLGRGGVLGDVESRVVQSAFGYFNATLLDRMWNSAREKVAPRDAARLHLGCCADFGRKLLAGVEGLDSFCDAAAAVNEAIDPTGLTLYAGVSAEPVPDDVPARALHLVACLREARGGAHLAAIRATGLDPLIAHFIRRGPDDWKLFGHQPEDAPTVTDMHRRQLDEADAITDRIMAPAFGTLDEAGGAALVAGLESIKAALSG